MRFGEIIKKSWNITWRYRALWILGVFAGVTGGGGAGGGGNGFRSWNSGTGSSSNTTSNPFHPETIRTIAQHWLPAIIVGSVLLFVIWLALAVIRIGARGGLVWAVNEIEEGRTPRLGESWNAGFARFWSLLGLALILVFPILIASLALVAIILVPLLGPLLRGTTPNPAAVLVPMCGGLAIGIPVLLVSGLILGVMYITATRFVMLEGSGAAHSIGESWHALRARFADHAVMYLINLGLNIAAGFVLAIPVVLLALGLVVPAAIVGASGHWGAFAVVVAVAFVILFVLGLAYAAIWGTFTSSLWTIFYRRLTGREPLTADASPAPAAVYPAPLAPTVPGYGPVTPAPFGYPQQQPAQYASAPQPEAPPMYPAPQPSAPQPEAPPIPAPPVPPQDSATDGQ